MDGNFSITIRGGRDGNPDPVVSFLQTDGGEPRPKLLVERLLYARALIQASPVLGPRFVLGDCAADHHILLGSTAMILAATDRLVRFGFRVAPSSAPPGIRFFVSSSHSEAEIRALLIAITVVVRELFTADDVA